MTPLTSIAYFFGGAFLSNAIPHLVSGMTGRAFQTPFAKPPGAGLSSALVNVIWGMVNLIVAYVLLVRVGTFDLRAVWDAVAFGAGFVAIGVISARHFAQFHGGDVKGA